MCTQDRLGSFNREPVKVLAIKNLADLVVYVSEPFSIMSTTSMQFIIQLKPCLPPGRLGINDQRQPEEVVGTFFHPFRRWR